MSDLSSESLDLARRAARECRSLRTLINGNAIDLSTLNTSAKNNLVAAVNELHSSIQAITWNTLSGKPLTFPPVIGSGAGDAVAGNDARLTNARTPTAHKSSHAIGGSDPLTPSDIGAQPAGSYAAASHTHTSADITDATDDATAQPGKVLRSSGSGSLSLSAINATSLSAGSASISSLSLSTALSIANGGTGSTTVDGARSNLGAVGLTGNETIAGNKTLTGQLELSASQAATTPESAMSRGLADAWELRNMNRVINLNNAPVATLNGGVTCLNSFDGDYMRVETGSTTPRPVIARARTITANPGTGLTNQVMPVQIAMLAFMGVSNNGLTRARFWHGGASSSTPPYGDQQPITGRGFGWEAYYNLANGRYEMAVFAHNGASYVYSDGLSGRPEPLVIPSLGSYTPHYFIIGLDAAGNVSLWVSTSMSPPGMTPSLVLAGGPTSGSYGTFGGVCWALAGPSSGTAGGNSDMRIIDRKMLLNP